MADKKSVNATYRLSHNYNNIKIHMR